MYTYHTERGDPIRNPEAYAATGAPMYKTKYVNSKNINSPTTIYKMNLNLGKNILVKQVTLIVEWMTFSGHGPHFRNLCSHFDHIGTFKTNFRIFVRICFFCSPPKPGDSCGTYARCLRMNARIFFGYVC